MALEFTLQGLVTDIDQLNRLYLQLRDVPEPVTAIFSQLEFSRGYLQVAAKQLAHCDVATVLALSHDGSLTKAFQTHRDELIDLEIFIDPLSVLQHSGPGSNARNIVPWAKSEYAVVQKNCRRFQQHILELNRRCDFLLASLPS